MISRGTSSSRTCHVEIFLTLGTGARTFQRGKKYAPIDLKCKCDTLINAIRCNGRPYMISTRISRSRTFQVETFLTHGTEARTFQGGPKYAPIDLKCECFTLINGRRCNGRTYMISTRILRSRTFHVEIFLTLGTEARTFQRGPKYARIDLKCECVTLINVRRCNGRKLYDIDTNLTFTHFSRGDIFLSMVQERGHFRESQSMHLLT